MNDPSFKVKATRRERDDGKRSDIIEVVCSKRAKHGSWHVCHIAVYEDNLDAVVDEIRRFQNESKSNSPPNPNGDIGVSAK